jgi:hypothetical protein
MSFNHRDNKNVIKQWIHVSIPITATSPHSEVNLPDLSENMVSADNLINVSDDEQVIDQDHYYLQEELSQQVVVIKDDTGELNIPIRQTLTMAIYINEAGRVDEVELEDKGTLSEEDQQQLIAAFKELVFLPGMRGTKVVKSLYRIQLKINRRLVIHY